MLHGKTAFLSCSAGFRNAVFDSVLLFLPFLAQSFIV